MNANWPKAPSINQLNTHEILNAAQQKYRDADNYHHNTAMSIQCMKDSAAKEKRM